MARPKLGVLFLAGDSWWQAGVCNAKEGPYAGFIQRVETDARAAAHALSQACEVVSSGLLHTTEDVICETRRFQAEEVDAIVFCPIIWTNDPPVIAFLQEAKRVPLLLWAYDPYGGFPEYFRIEAWLQASGPVSVQQCSNLFRRFGWDYEVVFGNEKEPRVLREIGAFAQAAAVKKCLIGCRIAVLPAPCRMVMGAWVDEFHLLERFGIELVYVTVDHYAEMVRDTPEQDAAAYVRWLKDHCAVVDTPDGVLLEAAKQALAMVRLAEELQLSGIALEDFHPDIYRLLGFRPHLYHPRLGELGCTVGLEADVPGVLAAILVSRLAGHIGMFNEFFSVDPQQNTVLMGHPGMGELSLGDPATYVVTPDLEFDASQPRGAWVSYRAKAGEITCLNLTPEYGKLKMSAFTAEALPGPRLMEGYAHMLVRPHTDALSLFKRIVELGLVQHWGTVHGDVLRELTSFARQTGLDLTVL